MARRAVPQPNKALFLRLGGTMMRRSLRMGVQSNEQDFKSFFGVDSSAVATAWGKINDQVVPVGAKPVHLLWACLWMKVHATESVLSSIADTTRKTFRKWAWIVIKAIADEASDIVSGCHCCLNC